jgi:hypothetical protein
MPVDGGADGSVIVGVAARAAAKKIGPKIAPPSC